MLSLEEGQSLSFSLSSLFVLLCISRTLSYHSLSPLPFSFLLYHSLALSSTNFSSNVAFGCGGAVAAAGTSSSLKIHNCNFDANSAPGNHDSSYLKYQGGGAICVRGDLEISKSFFSLFSLCTSLDLSAIILPFHLFFSSPLSLPVSFLPLYLRCHHL